MNDLAPRRDAAVAAAQARRDRGRLDAALAEIAALRRRVEELERSPSRLALTPLRRAVHAVAPMVRTARRLLGRAPAATAAPSLPSLPPRGLALVIDHAWPQPDRDSGSVDVVVLLQSLARLGFEVILAAARQHDGDQPARDRLQQQGIRCLQPSDAASVEQFLMQRGPAVDLCVLCRVFCGGEFLELAQQHCRKARLVFNAIDLNFLREERRARVQGDGALSAVLEQVKAREEHVIRSCDATMVVSQAEEALLAETMPDSLTVRMPLARPVRPPATPFEHRGGIGFIGGFAHAPNVDAVRFFLADIWPMLQTALPGVPLSIVGADAPAGLLAGCTGPVRLAGHLPDVEPWFESLRLTVAPLRFGAGAKGKIASSLAAGVPCVATSMAAEGMSLSDQSGVLVADSPAAFAAAVVSAYGDAALWRRLSSGGLDYAATTLSANAWQGRLDTMLRRIGV